MAPTKAPYLKNLTALENEAENLTARTPLHAAVPHAVSTAFTQCTVGKTATSGTVPTVTTPAVPLTTVPVTNTTGYEVSVDVVGGTVTVVTVNGSVVGAGDGAYIVPAGGTIALTYSAAPTWVWSVVSSLPESPVGYIEVLIGGNICKIPYFDA
jgi:hypothetical protein